jgi:hypothetical protein
MKMSNNERSDSGPFISDYEDMDNRSQADETARIKDSVNREQQRSRIAGDDNLEGVTKDAADKIKKVIQTTGKKFNFHPTEIEQELNRDFAMRELEKSWGPKTEENLKMAKFIMRFAKPELIKHLETTGIGSHHLMISAVYDVAKQLEAELARLGKNQDDTGQQMISNYSELTKRELQQLEAKASEMLGAAIHKAESAIIAKHGPM